MPLCVSSRERRLRHRWRRDGSGIAYLLVRVERGVERCSIACTQAICQSRSACAGETPAPQQSLYRSPLRFAATASAARAHPAQHRRSMGADLLFIATLLINVPCGFVTARRSRALFRSACACTRADRCGDGFDGRQRDNPSVPCVARGASAEPCRLRGLAWQAQRMLVRGAHSAREVGPCVHLAGACSWRSPGSVKLPDGGRIDACLRPLHDGACQQVPRLGH